MGRQSTSNNEIVFTACCILIGVSVAASLSPKNNYFIENFIFYWLPQFAVLTILFIARYKPPIICGVALILSAYLGLYYFWIFSKHHSDSMAWLGYVFSFPGIAIGALISAPIIKYFEIKRSLTLGSIAFLTTLVGLALNQTLICTTLMFCSI